jgi:hypothetical protein
MCACKQLQKFYKKTQILNFHFSHIKKWLWSTKNETHKWSFGMWKVKNLEAPLLL